MENISVYIVLIFCIYLIGFLYKRYYLPKIKGAIGEHSIAKRLRKLNKKEYRVYNDIYIKLGEKTTQIDHLVISIYGIFVIETKNYNGWIHGSEKSEYWTQSIYGNKTKFRNPIKQNWAHIYFLKNCLPTYKTEVFHPITVFTGRARLKYIYTTVPVIYKHKLLKTIKQTILPCLTFDQVEDIHNQIRKCVIDKKRGRKAHKKYVRRNIQQRKKDTDSLICPNCGGSLVLRSGHYGKFYGCSNYPKCKFSKNINPN